MVSNIPKAYDIVIVGGGFVGASLALALAKLSLRIALVDAKPLAISSPNITTDIDRRAIALAHSSQLMLKALDIWPQLAASATGIQHIHVSDQGHFGATRFQAAAYQVPAFGYVVPAQQLGQVLQQALMAQTTIDCIVPATLTNLEKLASPKSKLTFNNGLIIETDLVIAADGSNSVVRQFQEIPVKTTEHGQSAIITNVELARAHGNIAYERFTANGPLAFLPLEENYCGVVWTVAQARVAELMALEPQQFCQRLQQQFGYRLGKMMRVGQRQVFPLRSVYAQEQIFPGLVLLGNAAHSLHPVGGQGLNLALRDVATLAEVIMQAKIQGENLGELTMLKRYQERRKADQSAIINFSERVVRIFSNDFSPLVLLRDLALIGIDILPIIKNRLVQRLMGVTGPAPRLACGLELAEE